MFFNFQLISPLLTVTYFILLGCFHSILVAFLSRYQWIGISNILGYPKEPKSQFDSGLSRPPQASTQGLFLDIKKNSMYLHPFLKYLTQESPDKATKFCCILGLGYGQVHLHQLYVFFYWLNYIEQTGLRDPLAFTFLVLELKACTTRPNSKPSFNSFLQVGNVVG